MSDPTPAVSIAIRAYRRTWLREAVASVLDQTHRDLELVLYDDAGGLDDIAREFMDARLRYHRAERALTASGRFTAAVALCRGRYIGVLDDDDRYEPQFVARLVEALERDPAAGIAFCRRTWEWRGGRVTPADPRPPGRQPHFVEDVIERCWTVTPSQMLLRQAMLSNAERVQPMPGDVSPDAFVSLRAAIAGCHLVHVDAPLVVCRWHGGQFSRAFPQAHDMEIATWRSIDVSNPAIALLRDACLARSLAIRSFERLRRGDCAGARRDLREAAQASPSTWRCTRWLLDAAAMAPAGVLAAGAWYRLRRKRRHDHPPSLRRR